MGVKRSVTRLTGTGTGLRLEVGVDTGHTLVLDNGEGNAGARPADLVGAALGGCTAMDVVSILRKKRQPFTAFEVTVGGTQMDDFPHAFTRFDIEFVVDGEVDPEAVRRAIELSATKYCAVGTTLASGTAELHYGYRIRTGSGEHVAEVLVTGPNVAPGTAGITAAGRTGSPAIS